MLSDRVNFNHYTAQEVIDKLEKREIKEVRIEEIPIGLEQSLYRALGANKTITSLYLDLRFDDPADQNILFNNLPFDFINRLEKVNYLSRIGNEQMFGTLLNCLSNSPNLKDLTLYCPIYPEKVAKLLSSSKSIQTLNLASCELGDSGAKELAEGVSQNKSLTELILTNCNVVGNGAVAIVNAVAKQGNIHKLSLRTNQIDTNELKSIVEILIPNKTLTHLDLDWLKINDEAVPHIADLIMSNQTLRKIGLKGCNISAEGIKVIKEALAKNNPCDRVVDLSWNVGPGDDEQTYQTTLSPQGKAGLANLSLLCKKSNQPLVDDQKKTQLADILRIK